jgi:hypothetical protein
MQHLEVQGGAEITGLPAAAGRFWDGRAPSSSASICGASSVQIYQRGVGYCTCIFPAWAAFTFTPMPSYQRAPPT